MAKYMQDSTDIQINEISGTDNINFSFKSGNSIDIKIGDLAQLETTDKSNLVSAINEVNNKFNYSTEEQVIGTDENGKPIYKRSFSGITNNYDFTTFTSDYSTNSITVRKAYGSIQTTNGGVAIGGYVNSNYFAGLFIHSEELQIYYGAPLKNANYNITIEFTKTTD